jgi:hypothetical protein
LARAPGGPSRPFDRYGWRQLPIAIADTAQPERHASSGLDRVRGDAQAPGRSRLGLVPAQPSPERPAPFLPPQFYVASSHPSAVESFSIDGVPFLAVLNRD